MAAPVEAPDHAPEIELTEAGGGTWRLHDHRGRPVVLVFHRHLA